MPEHSEQPERTTNELVEQLTFAEAAARLGLSVDAVRMRAHRGKLATVRIDERTFVLWPQPRQAEHLNEQRTERTGSANRSSVQDDDRLVAALEARIVSLERQLAERTEEIRRRDHIIAGFIERLPALPETTSEPPDRDAAAAANEGRSGAKTVVVGSDAEAESTSLWSRFWRALTGR
jgi:hypothetical protein